MSVMDLKMKILTSYRRGKSFAEIACSPILQVLKSKISSMDLLLTSVACNFVASAFRHVDCLMLSKFYAMNFRVMQHIILLELFDTSPQPRLGFFSLSLAVSFGNKISNLCCIVSRFAIITQPHQKSFEWPWVLWNRTRGRFTPQTRVSPKSR